MNKKELKNLIKKYHLALEEKNKEDQIKYLLKISEIHFNNQNYTKAEINFKKILEINNKYTNINYYLALIEIENNKTKNYLEKAQKYLEKELEINPKNKDAKTLKKKIEINNNFPLITLLLIIMNSIVFYFTFPEINKITLIKYTLISKNITFYKIITSIFFHYNYIHFFSNILILLLFGLILEKQIGSLKYLIIFLSAGIFGNLFQTIIMNNNFVLGASAGIFGIIGSLIILKPKLELKIFGIIKIPLILFFSGYFIFSNLLTNSFFQGNVNVGDLAHILGFFIGIFITGILYHEKTEIFYNWIIITLGFYLINKGLIIILKNKFQIIFLNLIQLLLYIFCGFILVYYGYKLLKYINIEED